MSQNLMDIKEVAAYLKMNKMTIYKLARQGEFPAFKVASEWRFKKELIDGWLLDQLKGRPDTAKLNILPDPKTNKTVLVVDDEEMIRDFFTCALKKEYSVLTAKNGKEAIDIILINRPDLVLLDINMPVMNGIETLKQIKQIDKEIAVVMLSAHNTPQTCMEVAKLGAFDSISKPFDFVELKSVIISAVSSCGKSKK